MSMYISPELRSLEFAHFKGGGNSSGGGGGSGQVDYPEYMKTQHESWLSATASAISSASSPFSGQIAYDPDANIATMIASINAFDAIVDALSDTADWQTAIAAAKTFIDASIIDNSYIVDDIVSFGDILDDEITTTILPRFESGMRDINAVMTSAFVVGKAIIESGRGRDLAKYGSGLKLALHTQRNEMIIKSTENILNNLMSRVDFERLVAALTIEVYRIAIVAGKEETDQNLVIAEGNASWPLEKYQHGANMLAAIGGGTATIPQRIGSTGTSALGGALSGAASGAMIGSAISPGWGTAIGAVIGGIGGFLAK